MEIGINKKSCVKILINFKPKFDPEHHYEKIIIKIIIIIIIIITIIITIESYWLSDYWRMALK